MSKSHKRKSHRARRSKQSRRRGGMAPVSHQDDGWASKRSMGQGVDYFEHHMGQHGGAALQGADLSSFGDALPSALRGSAHLTGQDNAFAHIRSMNDQAGGRRSKQSRRSKKSRRSKQSRRRSKSKKAKKSHRRSKSKKAKKSHRRRGGALGFASYPSNGMLLSGSDYAKAGLNPHWRDVEVNAAQARASM